MDIQDRIDKIETREDLSRFVDEFRLTLKDKGSNWENRNLPSYLEAMSAWIFDMDGYYENNNQPCPDQPTWKVFAQILAASAIYE